jgi:hypothetical protein
VKTGARTAFTALAVAAWLLAVSQAGNWGDDEDDDRPRSGKISCWWVPDSRPASIVWRFGRGLEGSVTNVTGYARSAPFERKTTGSMRAGDVVSLTVIWSGATVAPGLLHTCTVKAGHNTKSIQGRNLAKVVALVPVT